MSEPNHCGYVAIVGRPNVGKSTLMNRLIGQKLAITSHKPQTTRHSILGIKTVDHGQIIYVDTPGIHRRGNQPMNRYLNRTAQTALTDVDLLLMVVQAGVWNREDRLVMESVRRAGRPALLAVNKIDLIEQKDELLPYLSQLGQEHDFIAVLPVSAQKGEQVEALQQQVLASLPESDNFFPEDQLTDRSERFFAAELVREQLTRQYHEELPYAVTVEIEQFEEQANVVRISAVIWVERPGQKSILIGKKGEALKQVGIKARRQLESFLDRRVHLNLWVKVKKSWSSDETALSRLGYSD